MRIGVYQNHPEFGETQANVAKAVQDLSSVDAQLVVLPELFNTGYQFVSMQEMDSLAEGIPSGDTCRAMISLARDRDMFLVFGLAEKDGTRFYNSAVLVGPDGFIGKYRKTHLFFEEKDFFSPGNTGFNVYDIGLARVGIMICFDWWFRKRQGLLRWVARTSSAIPQISCFPTAKRPWKSGHWKTVCSQSRPTEWERNQGVGKNPLHLQAKAR